MQWIVFSEIVSRLLSRTRLLTCKTWWVVWFESRKQLFACRLADLRDLLAVLVACIMCLVDSCTPIVCGACRPIQIAVRVSYWYLDIHSPRNWPGYILDHRSRIDSCMINSRVEPPMIHDSCSDLHNRYITVYRILIDDFASNFLLFLYRTTSVIFKVELWQEFILGIQKLYWCH